MIVALHDLGLAARWCDRLLLLRAGRLVADGPPEAVLTAATLAAVYGVTAHIGRDAHGPIIVPTGLARPLIPPQVRANLRPHREERPWKSETSAAAICASASSASGR